MRWLLRILGSMALVMTSASAVFAHDALPGESGFIHAVTGIDHFTGFVVIGAMIGAYLRLLVGRPYVLLWVLPFVLLPSHAHMPIFTGTGLVFSMGFLGAGLLIGILTAGLAVAVIERLGVAPPRKRSDGQSLDRPAPRR